jgi:ribosomal-protein-alanine N-acetyltransferase
MITIQRAETGQIPQIAQIEQACFPDPWSEKLLLETLQNDNCEIWCACTGEQVLGYVVLSATGDQMNLDILAVAKAHRRQGIAAKLLETVHQAHQTEFLLEVRASNTAALALYQSFGYKKVGQRRRYYRSPTEDAVLLTRAKPHCSPPENS